MSGWEILSRCRNGHFFWHTVEEKAVAHEVECPACGPGWATTGQPIRGTSTVVATKFDDGQRLSEVMERHNDRWGVPRVVEVPDAEPEA